MSIKDWHKDERPREKLLRFGAHTLSDAEILAIFINRGTKGKTAVDVARETLQHSQGLSHLLALDEKQFCQLPGLGPTHHVSLQAALELARRFTQDKMQKKPVLQNTQAVKKFLALRLKPLCNEVFACLFLDQKYQFIEFEVLFHGTIDHSPIFPRELIKRCLQHNASAIIFAHNHPSGCCQPSEEDKNITKELTQALAFFNTQVVDHFLVADNTVTSFAELGLV